MALQPLGTCGHWGTDSENIYSCYFFFHKGMGTGLLLGKSEIPDLLTQILWRGVWSELHISWSPEANGSVAVSQGRDFVFDSGVWRRATCGPWAATRGHESLPRSASLWALAQLTSRFPCLGNWGCHSASWMGAAARAASPGGEGQQLWPQGPRDPPCWTTGNLIWLEGQLRHAPASFPLLLASMSVNDPGESHSPPSSLVSVQDTQSAHPWWEQWWIKCMYFFVVVSNQYHSPTLTTGDFSRPPLTLPRFWGVKGSCPA